MNNPQILPVSGISMDNVKNAQDYVRGILTFMALTLGFSVALTLSVSNVEAAPMARSLLLYFLL